MASSAWRLKKFNLKAAECDIWKVFEVFKPLKVLPFSANAQKSACDSAATVSSVLILQVFQPPFSVCLCMWVRVTVAVLMHIYMYVSDSEFIVLLWLPRDPRRNGGRFTLESAPCTMSESAAKGTGCRTNLPEWINPARELQNKSSENVLKQ